MIAEDCDIYFIFACKLRMGSVCCVSGRDATTSEAANTEILRRTIQYSPSWGTRWDNRGRVAGEDAAVDRVRWNGRLENKSEPFFEPSPEIRVLQEVLDDNLQTSSPFSRETEGVGMQSKIHISGRPLVCWRVSALIIFTYQSEFVFIMINDCVSMIHFVFPQDQQKIRLNLCQLVYIYILFKFVIFLCI